MMSVDTHSPNMWWIRKHVDADMLSILCFLSVKLPPRILPDQTGSYALRQAGVVLPSILEIRVGAPSNSGDVASRRRLGFWVIDYERLLLGMACSKFRAEKVAS